MIVAIALIAIIKLSRASSPECEVKYLSQTEEGFDNYCPILLVNYDTIPDCLNEMNASHFSINVVKFELYPWTDFFRVLWIVEIFFHGLRIYNKIFNHIGQTV